MKANQAITYSSLIAPVDAATTAQTAAFDCQGGNYATIVVNLSAEANTNSTNVALQLSESDDNVATNYATFDADFNRTVDNTSGVVAVNHLDLEGRKRYIKLTVTPDTTTNGAVGIAATGLLCKDVLSGTISDYGDDVVVG
jgi:hypothetical protein